VTEALEAREALEGHYAEGRRAVEALRAMLERIIIGQDPVVDLLIRAVLADGHVLIEGLPGLGKTLMVKTLARGLSLDFNRIQFTPDLMPADITGTTVISTDPSGRREYSFEPGPLFTNLLLADEINRAGPKTQSALLQAMQERVVSIFGRHYPLGDPFIVFATQNPIELAGTYPLPEAQLDRFLFKVIVPQPGEQDLSRIAQATIGAPQEPGEPVLTRELLHTLRALIRQIPVADDVVQAAARAVAGTRPDNPASPPLVRRYVRYGVSPRALQSLLLAGKALAFQAGRFHVALEDIRAHWYPVLRHRLLLDVSASIDGVGVDAVLEESLAALARG
jgi:MoxR-like ATPase